MLKQSVNSLMAVATVVFCSGVVAGPEIAVTDAVIRGMPPGQPNTSAYLSVHNRGATSVILVGGHTTIARKVEIHRTREVDGLMRMERLGSLNIGPGEQVHLKPGATHLMLLGMADSPVVGDSHRLCLEFAATGSICVDAEVRKPGDENGHHHHHH